MNNRASMGGPNWPLFVMLVAFAIAVLLLTEFGLI